MVHRVVILDDYQNVATTFADWAAIGAPIDVVTEHIADDGELIARLTGADVVVAMRERTPFPAGLLRQLPDMRLLVTTGRRNASIDLAAAKAAGVVVCSTGYVPSPTSEHTWALILAAARRLPVEFAGVRNGGWQQTVGIGLHGNTLGLLGLGNLGSRVAKVGQAFGMRTVAWSQHLTAERAAEHGVVAVTKAELFAQSDVLSVHLVLSDRTRGLVGADELATMKPTSILVNTSRGPIVDETALLAALRSHAIGAAALDVFDVEPLPADHPFRTIDNVVMTPHLGYVITEQYEIFYRDAVENILAFAAGDPIRVLE